MKIKWYWLMETLGLVKIIPGSYGYFSYEMNDQECAGAEFLLLVVILPAFFFLCGMVLTRCQSEKRKPGTARVIRWILTFLLVGYAILLVTGVGPYIDLYPKGGGFISFPVIDHIIYGSFCGLDALMLYLGSKCGKKSATGN